MGAEEKKRDKFWRHLSRSRNLFNKTTKKEIGVHLKNNEGKQSSFNLRLKKDLILLIKICLFKLKEFIVIT